MADCKVCGAWFSSSASKELCPTCERALRRLDGYAVPVVRCNDCKHSNHCTIELELAKYWMPLSEHFCSYGERRTDNG